MQLSVDVARVDPVEVSHRQAKEGGEGLKLRCAVVHYSRHLFEAVVDQGGHAGGREHVRRYGTGECQFERVGLTDYPRGRSYTICATVVAAHEYVRYRRPNRTCLLLQQVRLVQEAGNESIERRDTSLQGS